MRQFALRVAYPAEAEVRNDYHPLTPPDRGTQRARNFIDIEALVKHFGVAWFNNHRRMEPLGYIHPAEAEANYYRRLASQAATPA